MRELGYDPRKSPKGNADESVASIAVDAHTTVYRDEDELQLQVPRAARTVTSVLQHPRLWLFATRLDGKHSIRPTHFGGCVPANAHEPHPYCGSAQLHFARDLVGRLSENAPPQYDFS